MSESNLAMVTELPRTHDKRSFLSANDDKIPQFLIKKQFEKDGKIYFIERVKWDLLNKKESTQELLIFHDGWRVSLIDHICYYEGIYSPMYELKFKEISPNSPEYKM